MTQAGLFDSLDEKKKELEQLRAQIEYHEGVYRAGSPEITDAAFDEIVDQYDALADELGVAAEERVNFTPGADHTEGFAQIEHRVPMLSLEKLSPNRKDSKGELMPLLEQLTTWYERRQKDLGEDGIPLLVEPKIDGISISLIYQDGKLRQAITRGDGKKGDDITRQVSQARAVPALLRGIGGTLEVRGEIYWPHDAFEAHNDRLRAAGEAPLVNPRNGCAGLMKRKEPEGLEEVGITAFLYQVPWFDGVVVPEAQSKILAWLADSGAPVYLDEIFLAEDARQAFDYCEGYHGRREALPYDIDGMVIKID
ncbi:MAG: hypothetical protein AAGF12_39445 [Myxococcota bacterium]